eukprot:CAMPEP_0201968120 /NCGR_PEP_ID=MMETSP0904-20121228/12600_1 /ASSEMBLY_ACC=CAM_ASM_000553 /TAXON_ID=420261 /ORGANISM="Thalassiosira antarctica, Strain CCMP982" /LENGTH=68 /DNA_ID=CAMNT_0048515721 /DNA_START=49 /DNA_END=256 /DNA_ORIENTATION=-
MASVAAPSVMASIDLSGLSDLLDLLDLPDLLLDLPDLTRLAANLEESNDDLLRSLPVFVCVDERERLM